MKKIVGLVIILLVLNSITFSISGNTLNKKITVFSKQIKSSSPSCISNSNSWYIETVDNMGEVGWFSNLVIFNDTIYIVYYDKERGNLRLVSQEDENWNVEVVDSKGDVGMYCDLVISSKETMHVSYYDRTHGDLRYAEKTDEGWEYIIIDEIGDTGRDTSIALDLNENVHISYYDETQGCLKHAVRMNGVWQIETIDNNGKIGCGTAIAIDNNDIIHISYTDKNEVVLWYAKGVWSNWEITCVDGESHLYGSTAICLDSFGNPHICYYDVTSPTDDWYLKYTTKKGDGWLFETIDDNLKYFWNEWGCSLDIDSYGRIHVGYYAWLEWNINYALKTENGWNVEVVKSEGSVGGYASIAVDNLGYPHLSFMDMNELSLNYAKKLNFSPEKPREPVGKKIGILSNTYQYETSTTDFDHDTISYGWDWGDDSDIEWTQYISSNTTITMNHSWNEKGTYSVRVKAKDEFGLESSWSDPTTVIMPKSTKVRYNLFFGLFKKFIDYI